MQTASQRVFKGQARSIRAQTIRAIHATWRKVAAPELDDPADLRTARLAFITEELGLRAPLKSMTRLKDAQLGRVLDALRELERAPALPGVTPSPFGRGPGRGVSASQALSPNPSPSGSGEQAPADIHHFATAAQSSAVRKLTEYLGWGAAFTEGFIAKRYGRTSPRMLTPAQANSLTMILLNIAGARAFKKRTGAEHAPRHMIRQEIPRLKRELGIDQKPPQINDSDFTEGNEAA